MKKMNNTSVASAILKIKAFAFDSSFLIGGQILMAVIALLSSALIARELGVEDRGYMVLAMLLPNILLAFSDFGLGVAATKFIASKEWLVSVVIASNLVLAITRLIVVNIFGIFLVHFFGKTLFPEIPKIFMYLGLLQISALIVQSMLLPIFLGLDKSLHYSIILLASTLLNFLVMIIVWLAVGLTVKSILILQAACALLTAAYIFWGLRKYISEKSTSSMKYIKKAFTFGSGIHISYICHFASEKLVLLVLNFFGGAIYVSLHTIAQALTERLYLITDAIGILLLPKIAEGDDANDFLTPLIFKVTIYIFTIISVCLIVLADWIIGFIYTSEFKGAVQIMQLLLVATIFSCGWNIISNDLNARGLTKEIGYINIGLAIISLSLACVFTSIFGLIGVALSSIAAYAITLVLGLRLFLSKTDGVTVFTMMFITSYEKDILKSLTRNILGKK